MTIAVTGATGQLGRLVIERLKGRDVIGLARSPDKLADAGVTARAFDYDKPETLAPALEGVDTLLLISGSEIGSRTPQHRAVIEAAKAAGVGRVVYTSLLRADSSPLTALAAEHAETEELLRESGLDYTILRNGWYSENYTASVPSALENGAFYGAAGDARIASAARADYADAAVAALTGADHSGKTYELAGSHPYTLAELAAEISRQTDREIPYVNLSEAEYAGALEKAGLPAPVAGAYAAFDAGAAQGGLDGDSAAFEALIGRKTTPLADAVRAAL
ncbi:MAG: SDR family oxidoreductase [Paracoccus sp. (in: a-proteobacteria)]|nr:SDR family oxidoreductase [Paracoccus sp. (in: a-proteobacteria)]